MNRWVTASTREEALAALGIREVGHRCLTCGSTEHGQPFAEGVGGLSLSNAGGVVLAAIADGPVGIDHEPIGSEVPRSVVAHTSETADPLTLWVRKEAILKATGLGLQVDPTTFWIDENGRPSSIAGYDGPVIVVRDLEVDGYVSAIATTSLTD
ncbi:MAG TPA: hypothetical protein VN108_11160 [Marmoricola sp.]|nr:hypothetical protein [Marmoricola sp.]